MEEKFIAAWAANREKAAALGLRLRPVAPEEAMKPARRQLSGAAESAHNGAHRRAVAVRIPSAAYRGGDSLAEITVGIYQYRGDGGCVVIAEGAQLDDTAMQKAQQQGVTVLRTDLPVFEAALKVHELIK